MKTNLDKLREDILEEIKDMEGSSPEIIAMWKSKLEGVNEGSEAILKDLKEVILSEQSINYSVPESIDIFKENILDKIKQLLKGEGK